MSGFPRLGYPAGMIGATAPSRYVGGTVTGAPVTGTFRAGDFVIAQDGVEWLCTADGSPGTWAQFAAVVGAFLTVAGNLSDVANVTTARNNLNAQEAGTSVLNADTAHNNSISTAGGGLGNGWVAIAVSGNADQGFWVQNVTPGATATTYVQAANDDRSASLGIITTSSAMNVDGLIHPSLSMLEADMSELLIFTSAAHDIIFAAGGHALADEVLRLVEATSTVKIMGAGGIDMNGKPFVGGVGLIGSKQHAPGSLANYATTSTTIADLDTTNMTVSFVAPPSGKVLVRLTAVCLDSVGGALGYWALRDHTSHALIGSARPVGAFAAQTSASVVVLVTGLTPGTTYQYDWAAAVAGGGSTTFNTYAYVGDGSPIGGDPGPAVMEVWAA